LKDDLRRDEMVIGFIYFRYNKNRQETMKKIALIILGSLFFIFEVSAQTVEDALRLSRLEAGGTARSISSGGALSAFGGDFGTLSVNPAGIATYRKSTLVITPSLNIASANSTFNEEDFTNSTANLKLENLGLVFSRINNNSDWKAVNFGIGINKLTNFNQEFFYNGTTNQTISQRWLNFANGTQPDNLYSFEEGVAYDAGVLFNVEGRPDDEYYADFDGTQPLYKEQTVTETGSITDLNLTLGGNYQHKLYVGVTLGMPIVSFDSKKSYTEIDELGISPIFNEMTYEENLETTGIGFNAKLGIIYRANQRLRIGAAIHTPTFFSLSDIYDTKVTSSLTFNGTEEIDEAESDISNFSYNYISPFRAIGSVGFLLGKIGFISGDVEYVNYAAGQFDFAEDPDGERAVNDEILDALGSSVNLRIGGEARQGIFAFRGGVGYSMSPYLETYEGAGEGRLNLSAGIGLREKNLFIDVGISNNSFRSSYSPYTISDNEAGPEVDNRFSTTRFVGSIGFRF
jgi:hypothetical protein